MFKKHFLGLGLIWLTLVLYIFFTLYDLSPGTQITYKQLINLGDQFKKDERSKFFPAKQKRFKVSKQIFYKKNLQRLQSRLSSNRSVLVLDSNGERAELVEHFRGIECLMQDKIDDFNSKGEKELSNDKSINVGQHIRYLKAKDASFFYQNGQLHADEVDIMHYFIPGLAWPVSVEAFQPLLKGHAKNLEFAMFKEWTFNVHGFQAIFTNGAITNE